MMKTPSPKLVPCIRTELPGPNARQLIREDHLYTSPSYTREYPLVVRRGQAVTIEDVDGNLFLDFTAGIAVCSTGHCHPRVVETIRRQAGELLHMSGTDFYYAPQKDLAKRLASLAPGSSSKRVFFTNSGAESVEAAFKLARYHTGRKHVIAFYGGFHGRTMGALSLTGSKTVQRRGFLPLVPEVSHVDFPICHACPRPLADGGCCLKSLDQIEQLFATVVAPDEVAAIIVEPIQGEGGYVVPPAEFHPRLKALAEKYGILYVVDEIQSGMGRTGKMFAIEHWGVEPDIICLAKGIASGLPLGAMIAKSEIMNWPPGSHASTFGGNPVSCAAALTTIDLLEERLIDNAVLVGEQLMDRLRGIASRHENLAHVRGKGLMIAVDVVRDSTTVEPDPKQRGALIQACFQRGLLLLACGNSAVRFCPPLIVSRQEVDTAMELFEASVARLANSTVA